MEAGTLTTARDGRSIIERPSRSRMADPLLRWVLTGLAGLILLLIAFFFIRLYIEAKPAFDKYGYVGFVFDNAWVPSQALYGALPLMVGPLITSGIAVVIGVPVAIATALYITELAPNRVRAPLMITAELLAAVPSVVYGLWGIPVLAPRPPPAGVLAPVGQPGARAEAGAGRAVAHRHVLVPAARRGTGLDPELLHRRAHPRDHDRADRQRDLARGDLDGALRPQGGGARARRDALGDDPHGGAPVLARGDLRRRDARPRPRDRRDDRGDDRHRQRAEHRRHDLLAGLHARRRHRQRVRRGGLRPDPPRGADGRRPRPLRPGPPRERASPLLRQPCRAPRRRPEGDGGMSATALRPGRPRRRRADRIARSVVFAFTAVAVVPLVLILDFLLREGLGAWPWSF